MAAVDGGGGGAIGTDRSTSGPVCLAYAPMSMAFAALGVHAQVTKREPEVYCTREASPCAPRHAGAWGDSAENWYWRGAASWRGSPGSLPGTAMGTTARKVSTMVPFSYSASRTLSGHRCTERENACATSVENPPDDRRVTGRDVPGTCCPFTSSATQNLVLVALALRCCSGLGTCAPSSLAAPARSTGSDSPFPFCLTANRMEVERHPYAMRSRSMASWSSDMCCTEAFMRSPSSIASRCASSASSSSAMSLSEGLTPASQSAAPAAISWRRAWALAVAAAFFAV